MYIEILKEGLIMMVIGMGTVFFFLTIMIYAMHLSSFCIKILNKYFPEEEIVLPNMKKKQSSDNEEIALAIACALKERSKAC